MKRAALILALGLSLGSSTFAQTFEDYFVDKTLRLDYIFMGNADKQDICLDELSVLPQWGSGQEDAIICRNFRWKEMER